MREGGGDHSASGSPGLAILLISAAALAYEVLLTRLLSIVQWHHFAYMVISLALLGYGASGTFLALARRWLAPRFALAFVLSATLFGITALACFLVVQRLPFNTLEILWDPRQWGYLLADYLLLFVPFFFAASCICLAFQHLDSQIPRLYGFDLMGAGLGALGVVLLLTVLPPAAVLRAVAALGLVAALVGVWEIRLRGRGRWSMALLLGVAVVALLPASWTLVRMSEYKELSQALRVPGTRVVAERHGPLGWVSVIASERIPLRHAPGLSLSSGAQPPAQLGVLIDGEGLSALNRYDGRRESLAFLDGLTSALPYHLHAQERVLVLGSGAGSGILQAVYQGAEAIDAVELNPQVASLLTDDFRSYAGWDHLAGRVRLHVAEARRFTAATRERYDLIQVSLLDSAGAASAGVYALSESYLYTVEALGSYLRRLRPGGMLAITRWVDLPPRDGVKLFATAVAALRASGVADPGRRLAVVRGWKTLTLVVKQGPLLTEEVTRLRDFCSLRSFDPVYFPGMRAEEANVYNRLREPYYHRAALALLGPEADDFIASYKFQVAPPTDDRPYYFNFFRWRSLPEILELWGRGGVTLLELGYPLLLATLAQAVLVSLVLVVLPMGILLRRRSDTEGGGYALRVAAYFLLIGLAFLFVEIAFIQKLILFLGHPLYSISVVLAAFLVFSGLGSRFAQRLVAFSSGAGLVWSLCGAATIAVAYLWLLPPLFQAWLGLPDPGRILISLGLIAPLAFAMGMPFPLALSRVSQRAPGLLPWAWGINGCASLVSAVLATLLAIHLGFSLVVILAACLYLGAACLRP